MNSIQVNDLPESAFDLIFNSLSLEDRIKARAVSRKWRNMINSCKPESLCYSGRPRGFILSKNRWVSGEFAQNFISSPKFESFFQTFGQLIFTNLKRLRLCELDINPEKIPSFAQTLNSFDRLQELDLNNIYQSNDSGSDFQLNLPMLKSISLEVYGKGRILLDAPRLQKVRLLALFKLKLDIVYGESVKKLLIDCMEEPTEVKKLKNLKYLYYGEDSRIDSTLLSTLEELDEIHVKAKDHASDLFRQKERYSRANLKIYLCGFRLNSPTDPAIDLLDYENKRYLVHLTENRSRLAAEVPLQLVLHYSPIEAVAPELEYELLKRFTDLSHLICLEPIQSVDRFLRHLKSLDIVSLTFDGWDPPQQLLDRLPDHCDVQYLEIKNMPADTNFLFGLKSMDNLNLSSISVDIEFIRKVFEELPFITRFHFQYLDKGFMIEIDSLKQFTVWLWVCEETKTKVSDVNAALKWIQEKAQQEFRSCPRLQ